MVEIKAGPELDRAVAKASGIVVSELPIDVYPDTQETRPYWNPRGDDNEDHLIPFHPGVDLNAAFAAAEKAGMFLELMRLASGWMATTYLMHGTYGYGDEPALAICAAILMLKKPVEVSE